MSTLSRRNVLQLALGVGALPLLPARAAEAQAKSAMPGWREALIVVDETRAWIETMTTVGGWEVASRGRPDASLNALWGLPPEARTQQTLLRNVGTTSGFMRLVVVTGVAQQRIRPHDQAWETGGISALDLRVVDMDTTRKALEARGWNGTSDPVRYKTYGFEVIQWAPRSPDGVRLSFIQRIAPPLQGWTELHRWSRLTNAAVLVRDMAAARRFQENALGLQASSASNTVGDAGPNVMGLPWALSAAQSVDIHGYSGQPAGDAAIELIDMPQSRGRDHSAQARPPNLGIAGLRFVVADLPSVAQRLADAGLTLSAPPCEIGLPPFGRGRACAVRGPDGIWLEFVEIAR